MSENNINEEEKKKEQNEKVEINEKELSPENISEELIEKVDIDEEEEDKTKKKTADELEIELSEAKDKLLRVLAENENIRKQSEKNRIDVAKYGVQPMARELVNVVDNFDRALSSLESDKERKTFEGFDLIHKDLLNILEKFNIKKVDALGKPFDANLHQAMFEKPTDEFFSGEVCEIVQEGYKFHERLLRPALVGIAKKTDKTDTEMNEDKEKTSESAQEKDFD